MAEVAGGQGKVSKAWYLVPFFFGIIGGIIGYLAVKDRNKNTAKNLLIFGIVWTLLPIIIIFAIGGLFVFGLGRV